MKIPDTPASNSNGRYNQDGGGFQYISDNTSDSDTDSPTQDGDFSEYLWMENEEEFDNQVLKQLEEEALMEQCIEAMLEDEGEGVSSPSTAWSTNTSNVAATSCLVEKIETLKISGEVVQASKLNPNATEFVPRQASNVKSVELQA